MTTSTHALVDRLVDTHPELRTLRQEHLDAYGELTAWLVNAYLADSDAWPQATWRRILADLEREDETGDSDVKELLSVSFLENLPYPDEPGAGIAEHLGLHLAELR
jgi:hypothetical protein